MKALSLKQPWADLVLSGRKIIELRKWNTNFRGEFYIHASRIPDKEAMKKFGFKDLPCGFILGKANLMDVKIYDNEKEFLRDSDRHLASNMKFGKYGFIINNVKKIEPTEHKGKLGFFEISIDKH